MSHRARSLLTLLAALPWLPACGGPQAGFGADLLPTSCQLVDKPEEIDAATARVRCRIVKYQAQQQEATVMSDDRGYQTNGIPPYWLEEAEAGAILNLQFPETERPPAEGTTLDVTVNKLVVRTGTLRGS